MPEQKSACKHGHPYPENAYVRRNGKRFCKLCPKLRGRESRRRNTTVPERFMRAEDRIWLFIDKTPGHGPQGDCWIWTRSTTPAGYGVTCRNGKRVIVSRLVLAMDTGKPIPVGMHACHHCDNPPCCRPSHLFLGTQAENQADMRAKGRGPDMRHVATYRRNPSGSRNGMSKLQTAEARDILTRGTAGVSLHVLAAEHRVSWSTAYNIVTRKSWKTL